MELVVELDRNLNAFWKAFEIYYKHPNSINKQVLYSDVVFSKRFGTLPTDCELQTLCDDLASHEDLDEHVAETLLKPFIYNQEDCLVEDIFENVRGLYFSVRVLRFKCSNEINHLLYEFCFFDFERVIASFHTRCRAISNDKNFERGLNTSWNPMTVVKYRYLKLNYDGHYLKLYYDAEEKGNNWVTSMFLPKLIKLMTCDNTASKKTVLDFTPQINVTHFYSLYNKLKLKYGKSLVDNWPEVTDPKKFVYEDIGIATYLMLVWNDGEIPDEDVKKQKFVDLGCGNGLLVYILNSEGHQGIGLDIRKRKIWDIYSPTTVLKEEAVIPSPSTVFPDADWLIGNHSDELTGWIPIIATMSNSHCQYFVLPCCPYKLNGCCYQRKNSSLSCYQDFIKYTQEISAVCGFRTCLDKLRIPSTKRICLIGYRDRASEKALHEIHKNVHKFINDECEGLSKDGAEWTSNFTPREAVEKVRNCTRLPQQFIDEILVKIVRTLLATDSPSAKGLENSCSTWNPGHKITIRELAESLPVEDLKILKQECKGLQTLLKNHHYIFQVNQGCVQFRSPDSMLEISQRILSNGCGMKWKIKNCWFFSNHPDGCPLLEDQCSYKHTTASNTRQPSKSTF